MPLRIVENWTQKSIKETRSSRVRCDFHSLNEAPIKQTKQDPINKLNEVKRKEAPPRE